ncbi:MULTISPECIES: hypothetical protein [Ensifer]|jgi:hypothetical protein|uniref:Uncharacterized protein n=1 Tax=Ensifer canadensis TaxID=555315 RepID=A0AAW4FLS8_9HYPH|nr:MULTISPECIES: hypothetical protein [Ensifer]MDP9633747.1 hypothetical protein [Ensifer adhaerens]KQU93633.1 hypothetical protein ASD00_23415 [Ensifer sp. Root31]KQW58624.1 hypothetical protein ASD02_06440 [Ensifer sp. Root1252]KQW74328.1 hypothetical protein ASD03_07095 [Ensifer sp. Root127]KQY78601.1 hypothetical protein ASD52_01760 [Ensifer sp. Root142]
MKTLACLILSAALAFASSLIIAGLFLPVYGIFEGGTHNCLNDGLRACVSIIPLSALIYGPLFVFAGVVVGTPIFMTMLASRG